LQVDLPKVQVKTGTEQLECVFKMRVKLYRVRDEQWKERGVGNCKLMRDRAQRRIRFLMRQEKTLKPVANFIGKLSTNSPTTSIFSLRHLRADCDERQ
jgi:Ran-binding protein 1